MEQRSDAEATLFQEPKQKDPTLSAWDQHAEEEEEEEENTPPLTPTYSPATPSASISSSELTLRFPRPQGDSDLANWVSTSDPNIMRPTTPSDHGLSESSYELISADEESESQDGFYGSMAGSVDSLDDTRADDTHSLASTEHTNEDSELVMDEEEEEEDDDDDEEDVPALVPTYPWSKGLDTDLTTIQFSTRGMNSAHHEEAEEFSQHDSASPSASLVTEKDIENDFSTEPRLLKLIEEQNSRRGSLDRRHSSAQSRLERSWNATTAFLGDNGRTICVWLLLFSVIPAATKLYPWATGVEKVTNNPNPQHSSPNLETNTQNMTTGKAIETIVGAILEAFEAPASSAKEIAPSSSPVPGMELTLVEDKFCSDWLFGKAPNVTLTPELDGSVTVHVCESVRDSWLSEGCLDVKATGGQGPEQVEFVTTVETIPEGLSLYFNNAHEPLVVDIVTTCRPKIHKTFQVHFNRGRLEAVVDMLRDFTLSVGHAFHALSEDVTPEVIRYTNLARDRLVDVAHQVDRLVSISVLNDVISFTNETIERISISGSQFIAESFAKLKSVASSLSELKVETLTQPTRYGLVDAQIAAKLFWLKATGRHDEHHEYQEKARNFLANKRADSLKASNTDTPEQRYPGWGQGKKNQGFCEGAPNDGRRRTKQCKHIS